MIKPTVGRVVWFRDARMGDGPFAAHVSYVWNDRMVNLMVINANGAPFAETSVTLVQEGDETPDEGCYCEWMPFQLGQAKAVEVVKKMADGGTAYPIDPGAAA